MPRTYTNPSFPLFTGLGHLVREQRQATTRKEELNLMATEARTLAERIHALAVTHAPAVTPPHRLIRSWTTLLAIADALEEEAQEPHHD